MLRHGSRDETDLLLGLVVGEGVMECSGVRLLLESRFYK